MNYQTVEKIIHSKIMCRLVGVYLLLYPILGLMGACIPQYRDMCMKTLLILISILGVLFGIVACITALIIAISLLIFGKMPD